MRIPFSKCAAFSAVESAAICVLMLLIVCWGCSPLKARNMWDFRSYYYSTLAYEEDLNPYDYEQVNSLIPAEEVKISREITYPYHPYTFLLFKPFTEFSYGLSKVLFLAMNIMAISFLLLLWRSSICSFAHFGFPVILILMLLGPGLPLSFIFTAGNPAAFEALLIFGGMALLLRGHLKRCWLLLSLAGFWKVISFVYIPLTLCWHSRKADIGVLAVILVSVLTLFFLPWANGSAAYHEWINYLSEVRTEGLRNHSALQVFWQIAADLGYSDLTWPLYITWCAAVLSAYFYINKRFDSGRIAPINIVFLLWTAALIMPRMRPYGFLVLVPALQYLSIQWPLLFVINIVFGIIVHCSTIPLLANHGLFVLNTFNWCCCVRLLAGSANKVRQELGDQQAAA
jgi:hypothetical protein